MISIKDIASYIPKNSINNILQAERFSECGEFVKTKLGALHLPRKNEEEETSDLAHKALHSLFEKGSLHPNDVQALIVVTQNGDKQGLPHTAAIVQHKAKLSKDIAAFDVSLGCSGYVYALSIVKGFMQGAGLKNAVLVTADPYSKVIDPNDRVTTLLFGDAATATWLSDTGSWDILPPHFGTDGSGAAHLEVNEGRFCMNGRQVFTFASTRIPEHIKGFLNAQRLTEDEIDLYCMHQGSAAIIEAISKRFPGVKSRFICDMADTGNTVSSSIPLILENHIHRNDLRRILISGFGVGLSWATTILERKYL